MGKDTTPPSEAADTPDLSRREVIAGIAATLSLPSMALAEEKAEKVPWTEEKIKYYIQYIRERDPNLTDAGARAYLERWLKQRGLLPKQTDAK